MTKQYFQAILFLLFCHVLPLTVTAQVVDIPDLNLRAAFEHALGKASGAIITTADMENLTSLETPGGVRDLTGLESATNLTKLQINGNVSDLSPLAGLTQLNRLQLLNASNLSDLSSLAGLTQLGRLQLDRASVSDLSPLEGLTNLHYLHLNENNISDLSPLEGLTNLHYLYLNENNISDLSSLEGLDRLIDLDVKGNPLSYQSLHTYIPTLQRRGGRVEFDSRSVADLLNISGVISASNNTLTILVRDSLGRAFAGVPVTFTVVSGGGTLSATNTTADEQGRAQSILTLGTGNRNSVEASVTGTTLAIILSDTVVPEVKLPDPNLRAAVEPLLGKASGAIITTADMGKLTHLHARNIDINDLTGLESATNLTYLSLNDNNISDISPLIANTGLGIGDHVHLWGNPLSSTSLNDHIPALRGRGVRVVPDEEAEPYTVGLIYFLPNDSQPRPNVDAQIDAMIKEIQESLAYWMEVHGFGRKTFTFQADATGKAVVHHVNGRFNQAYYFYDQDGQYDRYAKWKVWDEIDEQFSRQRTIYVCLIDGLGGHSGLGSGSSLSGRAVIRSNPSVNFHTGLVAHELMHAFGLNHTHVRDYKGVVVNEWSEWDSACRTEWLDVHRYLNPTQRSHDVSIPRVRMLPPSFVSPPNTIRLRFEVEDDDGLHQAQLLRNTHDAGVHLVVACKRLTGTHSTVEFVTTALQPKDTDVTLSVIDVHGNFSNQIFPVDVASIIPPPQVVSVPDAHLAAKLRTLLGLDPSDPITSHRMLSLSGLSGGRVADLTGIDSAINVIRLSIANSPSALSLSPLVDLTNLSILTLSNNSISDLSPLAGLTNLGILGLPNNSISDISPLAGLTNLSMLDLSNNSISDLSPLAGLKNLRILDFSDNSISDISPLAGLTNVQGLYLSNNSISDLSPLVENTGLGSGHIIRVNGNPLSYQSIHTHIPILQSRGISVEFDNQAYKALLKISGDDQKGKSGAALANPFVIEVRDENGSALEGISVTFSVTTGDGTLSVTSTTTDPNGRAETTLTLGPNPGTNTVQVSAAGIETLVIFNAAPTEYLWSIPAGISLIHVPLKVTAVDGVPKTITSIADLYDALGGVDTVNLLGTHDSKTRRWFSYIGTSDRGTSGDQPLTDDTGVIASMKNPVVVRLRGDPLGTNRSSAITLYPGINIVGVPLRDLRIARVSDLFALNGIRDNVIAITVSAKGEFHTVRQVSDTGDIHITGGQSFNLKAQEAATVAISGDGWYNASGTAASPPMPLTGIQVTDTTPVLELRGSIIGEEMNLNSGAIRVIVENLSNNTVVTGITSEDEGVRYQASIVDMETGRAAKIGDRIQISVRSSDLLIGVQPPWYTITAEDVRRNWIQLPTSVVYEIPAKTELLANYPNPFNPETWIPYRLAEDAFVTLTIYDTAGQVVRSLDVGHKIAAVYEGRSKAIYWDGRNDLAERVASGVYFYTLTAAYYYP